MLNKKDVTYFNYSKEQNKKFWRRLNVAPNLKGKSIETVKIELKDKH